MALSNHVAIVQAIKTAKKYQPLYTPTIERIVQQAIAKYGEKQAEQKARQLLHQIWGAYYATRPNFAKLLKKFSISYKLGMDIKTSLLLLLQCHSSTHERIPILGTFYQQIFAITGIPQSIVDYGCGLNPLTYPWMDLPKNIHYQAYDIDEVAVTFLQEMLAILQPAFTIDIAPGDILSDTPATANVAFLFKLLPVLEQQQKHSSVKVLQALNCDYIVATFPVASIGGRDKGMHEFYLQQFVDMIKHQPWKVEQLTFATELVFVVKK